MGASDFQPLAVGFFDGVHLGHRAILAGAGRALTFRNHPLSVLDPARAPRLIMSLESRLAAIRAQGVPQITVLDFTPELASMSAADFAAHHLAGPLEIRCGANWRFGCGGTGDAAFLRSRGYCVSVVPYASRAGEPVSSSRIRRALAAGDLAEARAMLGRAYACAGTVVCGKGLGAAFGFPTMNVRFAAPHVSPLLPRGVYVVSVGGRQGLANFGRAPTMRERAWNEDVLEIHFPGCTADELAEIAPGDVLEASFERFVRPERTFASVEDLRAQIAQDLRAYAADAGGKPRAHEGAAARSVRIEEKGGAVKEMRPVFA